MRTDPARLAMLKRVLLLDLPSESLYDKFTQLLAENLDVPIAILNLLDADRDLFKSCIGLSMTESPAATSFCEAFFNTTVDFANNGQEGVQKLMENHYDIILMDLQMPIMDGYEATIAIRNGEAGEDKKSIPIIALTADVMESTKTRVIEIGMNKYLSKPVDKDTLFEIIKIL